MKKRIIVKILLWIFFLPIMATIATCRTERITITAKIFSVCAIWVILFSILIGYGNDNSEVLSSQEPPVPSESTLQDEITSDNDDTIVYITPSGKKYHALITCAGGNAIEKRLSEVEDSYSPCKTCASHLTDIEQITPEETTTEITTPEDTTPEVTTPEVTTPEVTTPEVTTPEVTTPETTLPNTTSPDVTTDKSETVVYITPTGKRYHYSLACAGKNGTPTTISEAENKGLTLCNTCKNKKDQ